MKKQLPFVFSWLLTTVALTAPPGAGARPNHPQPPIPMPTPFLSGFGGLLAGVTPNQKAAWIAGLQQFQVVDSPADGLGPIFNNQSCVACHSQPVVAGAITPGGASAVLETRFGNLTNGVFNPLTNEGGTLLHQMALVPFAQETVPSDANVVASRKTTPLFGMGLIEAIPDATIEAQPDEMRTAPLWGLRARSPFLHDGRASTIREAILLHDGEARIIRERFADLSESEQNDIIAFLESI